MRTLALVTVLSAAACAAPVRQVTTTPVPATTTTAKRWERCPCFVPATTTTTVYVSPIPRNRTEACIVAAESGGRWYPEPPGDGGQRYQVEYRTWVANGGDPARWGHATPAEQDAVFETIVSRSGYSAWTRYDGCAA